MEWNMGNGIVAGILCLMVAVAIRSTAAHFRGQGGCCGGGGTIRETKRLTGPKLGEKLIQIDGMHCENCRNRIEHGVNQLDGVVCRVSLRKRQASISYSEPVKEETLCSVIENLGYQVVGITEK
ncbi:MAG: heavy-metal-associated domain-containing protein [Lachnospiraceae bacterium]|nr:heavy-metal-associated domain-containing protein [Lachnospiraceae bacterium]